MGSYPPKIVLILRLQITPITTSFDHTNVETRDLKHFSRRRHNGWREEVCIFLLRINSWQTIGAKDKKWMAGSTTSKYRTRTEGYRLNDAENSHGSSKGFSFLIKYLASRCWLQSVRTTLYLSPPRSVSPTSSQAASLARLWLYIALFSYVGTSECLSYPSVRDLFTYFRDFRSYVVLVVDLLSDRLYP